MLIFDTDPPIGTIPDEDEGHDGGFEPDPRDCNCCGSGLCRWAGPNDHDDY